MFKDLFKKKDEQDVNEAQQQPLIRKVMKRKGCMDINNLRPVIVLWKDITGVDKPWIDPSEVKNEHSYSCQRLCYLVEETEDEIYFVAGSSADGFFEELNVMPKGAVKEIIPVDIKKHKKKIINFLNDGQVKK